LIDEKIHVAIRSYKRAGMVRTLKEVPYGWIWVPESQGDEYRRFYGEKVRTIPDECDGTSGKKMNAILDRSPCEWTLILDDDINGFGCYEDGYLVRRMRPDHVRWMIEHFFCLSAELGIKLWGINQLKDPLAYRCSMPFSFLTPILGPFMGHLSPELRCDESFLAKSDYDFWLENIRVYHKTFRVNKYHYNRTDMKKGGVVGQRTQEVEWAMARKMEKKWGTRVFKIGGSCGAGRASREVNPHGNILNSLVRVPIRGV